MTSLLCPWNDVLTGVLALVLVVVIACFADAKESHHFAACLVFSVIVFVPCLFFGACIGLTWLTFIESPTLMLER